MAEQSSSEELKLNAERMQYLFDTRLKPALEALAEVNSLAPRLQASAIEEIGRYAISLKMAKLDKDSLEAFYRRPYPRMEPARDKHGKVVAGTWRLSVPRFIPLSIGFLESQDEAWNYFRVNRFMDWFGEIPDFIKKEIGWKAAPDLRIAGEELVGSTEEVAKAAAKYKGLVSEKAGKVLVNPNRTYELIVQLLKDGVKPFSDNPVTAEDLTTGRCDYELRDYQKEVWNLFCRRSNIGVYIPPSTGKTVIGIYALTHLKGPHLVVVPTVTLKEQWADRVETHTDLKLGVDVVVATYQEAIRKLADRQWSLVIFDECHHLPAHYFIKLSLLKRKYGIGLSATPYREDEGGEELIFALTGTPTGLGWQHFRELGIIKSPVCHVWVERNVESKLKRLASLMAEPKKTIIFSDSLELGKSVAARYNIPFVYGASTDRLKTLDEALAAVVSRVGDEGVSLPDIERVIEISWLFGSRRQELQRFTRLLHGQKSAGEAHVLMTLEEYVRDRKRLFSIMDRGFKIVLHREGVEEKAIQKAERDSPSRESRAPRPTGVAPTLASLPQIPSAVTQRLPGITRTLERLSPAERAVASTILGNPSNEYAVKELALATGYTIGSTKRLVSFAKLISLGLIKKAGAGKYRSAL
ncbi:MAG: DEAD/DEAH box helicase family protein [Thaumarchaeota archaeon]|nr:DEAD/DEAH box helicase family protein [Nitrososphaerota archaeon]